MSTKLQEQTDAIERLRELVKPGDTLYTILRHVSRSGMSRSISLVAMGENGPHDLDGLAARAMGYRYDRKNGGLKIGGCGMDMGFAIVYDLSGTLYPKHNGGDGGYAISQRWL